LSHFFLAAMGIVNDSSICLKPIHPVVGKGNTFTDTDGNAN
jgi:hypothetical protein